MIARDIRRHRMLVGVRDFGQTRRAWLPENSVGGQAVAAVATAVSELDRHARRQPSALREGQRAKAAARRLLMARLQAIRRTARAIAEDVPGFDDPFQLAKKPADLALITIGRVFVDKAAAYPRPFIAHGLAETFTTDLRALVDAYEKALNRRESARVAQIAARAGTQKALRSGLAASRKLDVIVGNLWHDDAVTMAMWKQVRRVEYPRDSRASRSPVPDALLKIA